MFSTRRLTTLVHKGLQHRLFSTTQADVSEAVAKWAAEPRKPSMVVGEMTHSSLFNLAMTLNGDIGPHSWIYNGASGAHPSAHWITCPISKATNALNPDGYDDTGIAPAPAPYDARMWAGGEIQWHKPMHIGQRVAMVTAVPEDPVFKRGKSGEMIFVTKHNEWIDMASGSYDRYVTEKLNYVFRDSTTSKVNVAAPKATVDNPSPLQRGVDFDFEREELPLSEVVLFRYSALSWNSHRIHYDKAFAQRDGYPDILVHGPLQATLLLDLAGSVSQQLAGEEPSVSLALKEELNKRVKAEQSHSHSHSHSHGGQPCDGHHEPEDIPELPWHARFQQLTKFTYKALRPLIVNTPVRILAKIVEDNHVTVESPTSMAQMVRNGPARVRLWVQDANDNDVVYMDGEALFEAPKIIEYSGVPEQALNEILGDVLKA